MAPGRPNGRPYFKVWMPLRPAATNTAATITAAWGLPALFARFGSLLWVILEVAAGGFAALSGLALLVFIHGREAAFGRFAGLLGFAALALAPASRLLARHFTFSSVDYPSFKTTTDQL
ncbi:hypothetical protein [Pararhizobium sp. PWRC1-1]|uniref:hypothetical protein n=1 Tax=Pararhizobium sp. PWRC1-1 TaxID=2804566 RepID=UPI003CEE2788